MKRIVLDASALMTYFENRSGAETVNGLITQANEGKAELAMSVVNWGEVYYSIWRSRGEAAATEALSYISQLPIEIVAADQELTKVAAEFRARYKLPYADCFGAALAALRKAPIATADRDFAAVKDSVELINI